MRKQPVQRRKVGLDHPIIKGSIMGLIKKVALSAMLIGSLAAPRIAEAQESLENLLLIIYSADYVKVSISKPWPMVYTRYEHADFDGAKSCMQELETPDGKLIDGLDNSCDSTIDAFIFPEAYNEVNSCDDNKLYSEICEAANDTFRVFINSSHTKAILDYWHQHRQDCTEKRCFATANIQQ